MSKKQAKKTKVEGERKTPSAGVVESLSQFHYPAFVNAFKAEGVDPVKARKYYGEGGKFKIMFPVKVRGEDRKLGDEVELNAGELKELGRRGFIRELLRDEHIKLIETKSVANTDKE